MGLPGRPFSGYGTITGQGNGQGGREHGQIADQLPGYRRLDDPAARAHVAAVWGIDPDELPRPGRSAWEMLDRLGKAAYLTFLGPLLGSLIRPVGGALADRLGGARVTFVNFVAMAAARRSSCSPPSNVRCRCTWSASSRRSCSAASATARRTR